MTGRARPTRGVPVVIGDGCVLAESAAVVESIDERWPSGPVLFPPLAPAHDPTAHGGKADAYLADSGQRLASGESSTALDDIRRQLALWENAATGEHRSSDLSVHSALPAARQPQADFVKDDVFGPRLALRIDRMQTLPIVQRTWPLEMSRFA
jgi:glutathione S-transferase